MKFYGIGDKDNRHCRTAVYNDSENSNEVSNWAKVRHWVTQGSVPGPLSCMNWLTHYK